MKNNVYPCKPQFYYIKVGFKGVNIIRACLRDAFIFSQTKKTSHELSAGYNLSIHDIYIYISQKHASIILTPLNPTFI